MWGNIEIDKTEIENHVLNIGQQIPTEQACQPKKIICVGNGDRVRRRRAQSSKNRTLICRDQS